MLYEIKGICSHCKKDINEQRELTPNEFENLKRQLEQTQNRDYSKKECDCGYKLIIIGGVKEIYI